MWGSAPPRRSVPRPVHLRFGLLFVVGGRAYTFTRVADPNRVLNEIAREEDRIEEVSGRRKEGGDLHLPYWAELWDSAVGVGEMLTRRQGDKGTRGKSNSSPCPLVPL